MLSSPVDIQSWKKVLYTLQFNEFISFTRDSMTEII